MPAVTITHTEIAALVAVLAFAGAMWRAGSQLGVLVTKVDALGVEQTALRATVTDHGQRLAAQAVVNDNTARHQSQTNHAPIAPSKR
jgi:hypothetical protein